MKNTNKLLSFIFILSLVFQSCSNSNSDEDDIIDPVDDAKSVSWVNNTTLGKILVDSKGMTLYYFSKDTKMTSECSGGCADAWPIFYDENLTLGTGLEASDFTTITRGDGKMQTVYKGWPLYYFANDAAAGETKGEGVNNVWFVAKPDYSVMYVSAQLVGADGKNYKSDYTEGDGATSYLTNHWGKTIYAFKNDTKDKNNFTNADFSNNAVWPIVEMTADQVPSVFNKADFGTIDVHGKTQLTYKGWPLYYFGSDADRGDNKGISVPAPGVWPIVNLDTPMAPEEQPKSVSWVEDATLGKILVDAQGMTLYYFSKDTKDTSECSGGCADAWPIFYDENLTLGMGLEASDFTTITRGDGKMQTVYKGWPLYYFANDVAAGETKGEAVNDVWFVAKPDYTVMYVSAQLVGADGKNYKSDYTEGDGATSYLTNHWGNTIYAFKNDTKDKNNFTSADFSNNDVWPIVEMTVDQVPSIFNKADFGTIDVHGKTQLTYKGWPLYYFGSDADRGDNKGISVPAPGVWPIVNLDTPMAPMEQS